MSRHHRRHHDDYDVDDLSDRMSHLNSSSRSHSGHGSSSKSHSDYGRSGDYDSSSRSHSGSKGSHSHSHHSSTALERRSRTRDYDDYERDPPPVSVGFEQLTKCYALKKAVQKSQIDANLKKKEMDYKQEARRLRNERHH
jgi:hypothetical protein